MESIASREKLTMAERLELWRASKLKEMKKNKKDKDSPTSQQRRNTFALSLLPSPGADNNNCGKENEHAGVGAGKRDRKAMKWKDQSSEMSSPEARGLRISLASPSPCQESSRRKWTTSTPPSPISTTSSGRRPMSNRTPSMCNILNNSSADGSGYVTAEEDNPDSGTKLFPSRLAIGPDTPKATKAEAPRSTDESATTHTHTPTPTPSKKSHGSSAKAKAQLASVQEALDLANSRAEKLDAELSAAREEVSTLLTENTHMTIELAACSERELECNSRCELANQDVESMMFLSSVTEQRVQELEHQISQDRMSQNEFNGKKTRKYKEECERLEKEKSAYETRANAMILELQGQMVSLQESAMGRISSLEEQVMEEGRRNEELNNQLAKAKQAQKRQSMMSACVEAGSISTISSNIPNPAAATGSTRQSICGGVESRGGRRQSKSSRRQSTVLPPPMLYDIDELEGETEAAAVDTESRVRAPAVPLYVDSDEEEDADSCTAMSFANNRNCCGTIDEDEEEEDA